MGHSVNKELGIHMKPGYILMGGGGVKNKYKEVDLITFYFNLEY